MVFVQVKLASGRITWPLHNRNLSMQMSRECLETLILNSSTNC